MKTHKERVQSLTKPIKVLGTMKTKILTNNLANATKEICENLYSKVGPSEVYKYANKIKLLYNYCEPCESETPTISTIDWNLCAVCGQNKTIKQ